MKRVRVEIEIIRRTYIEFEAEDDADDEDIGATALEESELAEWEDEPAEVVSIELLDDPGAPS